MGRMPAIVTRQLRRPYVEYALCLLVKRRRMALPQVDPAFLWPDFPGAEVRVATLPKGAWAAPASDTLVLMKLAAATQPRSIVELGSYRGYSARALLENARPDATLVAVDIDPQHGEAYRGTALSDRIDRRVGAISLDLFEPEELGSFDLVFVDADHRHDAVVNDTEVARRLVRPDGTLLWHDYANWGYFTGDCQVPEVLNELSRELPIAHLLGSNIAVHLPSWSHDRGELDEAIARTREELARGHWRADTARPYA